jgi:D-alanyl-D-alanine carboxypeptidase
VTLGGPGRTAREGDGRRIQDARTATDWAFASFYTRPFGGFPAEDGICGTGRDDAISHAAIVLGGKANSVQLVPVNTDALTVPAVISGESAKQTAERVMVTAEYPKSLKAPFAVGTEAGKLVYQVNGILLREVLLVTDRAVPQANIFKKALDALAGKLL